MSDPLHSSQSESQMSDSSIIDPSSAEPSGDGATALSDADALQRELGEQKEKYLRLAAEYDNFRRRAAKERQEAGWRAQGDLVRGLLDAIDDITRFAHVDPSTLDSKTVVEGVLMVEKKLFKSLAGHGFETIDPTLQPFDPTKHEAVTTTAATSADEDGMVAATFQVGYIINGHVLRPARVVVKQWSGHGGGAPVTH